MIPTRAPYLSLTDAIDVVNTLGIAWEGSDHQKIAHNEGWGIFNLPSTPNNPEDADHLPLDAGIERYDSPEEWNSANPIAFTWDGAVVSYCLAQALEGSQAHATALKIEHALNSMRYHVWGEPLVDSRLGPD